MSGVLKGVLLKERALMKKTMPRIYQEWLDNNPIGVMWENGIKIYGSQELEERNITFECDKYLPLYVAVGDDSGDALFFMQRDVSSQAVYASDVGDMMEENLVIVSNDFNKWIEGINETDESAHNDDCCEVYMQRMPDNITDIISKKKILRLNMPTGEIVRALKKQQPFLLIPRIHKCKLQVLMRGHEDLLGYLRLK